MKQKLIPETSFCGCCRKELPLEAFYIEKIRNARTATAKSAVAQPVTCAITMCRLRNIRTVIP